MNHKKEHSGPNSPATTDVKWKEGQKSATESKNKTQNQQTKDQTVATFPLVRVLGVARAGVASHVCPCECHTLRVSTVH